MNKELPLIFCNIGWMSHYEGIAGQPDKIVGGGRWVDETESGGECCNFLVVEEGKVYGHVETIHGKADRRIALEMLDPNAKDSVQAHVIWTATHPKERGRRIVGWYKNATVYRERQHFHHSPSKQHKADGVDSYRIVASAGDAYLLTLHDRGMRLGRGTGWMGHNPWWYPKATAAQEIQQFVRDVYELLDGNNPIASVAERQDDKSPNSPGPSADGYTRYVEKYEIRVSPRHHNLQAKFREFLSATGVSDIRENVKSVDLIFSQNEQTSLVEIKPCEKADVRFAVRTAMGQLLDYRQRWGAPTIPLIVVEQEPQISDQELALSNGFGIAYPKVDAFEVKWPEVDA